MFNGIATTMPVIMTAGDIHLSTITGPTGLPVMRTKEQVFLAKNRGRIYLVHIPAGNKQGVKYRIVNPAHTMLNLMANQIGVTPEFIQNMVYNASDENMAKLKLGDVVITKTSEITPSNYTSSIYRKLIDKLKPEYKPGPGFYNAPTTKQIYMPEKTYLSASEFVKKYPFTRTALVIVILDKYLRHFRNRERVDDDYSVHGWHWEKTNAIKASMGWDNWEYIKKIDTYKDIIRFAEDPTKPMNIDFSILRGKQLHDFAYAASLTISPIMHGRPEVQEEIFMSVLRILMDPERAKQKHVVKGNNMQWNLPWVGDYLRGNILAKKLKIMNNIIEHGLQHFATRTFPKYVDFKQVYGKFSNVNQVPANTIAYTIKNLPPPVPEEVKDIVHDIKFWSALFNSKMGNAVFSAVGFHMPVSVTTRVEEWKTPEKSEIIKRSIKAGDLYIFKIIFQDFHIIIGTNMNILVVYDRGHETITAFKAKKSIWRLVLFIIMVIIAIVVTYFTWGAGASASAAWITGGESSLAATTGGAIGAVGTAGTVGAGSVGLDTAASYTAIASSPGALTGAAATQGITAVGVGGSALSTGTLVSGGGSILSTGGKFITSSGGVKAIAGAGTALYTISARKKAAKEIAAAKAARDAGLAPTAVGDMIVSPPPTVARKKSPSKALTIGIAGLAGLLGYKFLF